MHVFDLDGTLLHGSSTIEISRYFGKSSIGEEIERRWFAGTITDREFWQVLLDVCGHATSADIRAAFEQARWMKGVQETFRDIGSRGEVALVISQSPIFFVRELQQWGAHETYGSSLAIGEPFSDNATLQPADKLSITKDAIARYGLAPEDCVGYGDSSSDVDLFEWLPKTVGVNPSPRITELTSVQYIGGDIGEAYRLGRRLLATDSGVRS